MHFCVIFMPETGKRGKSFPVVFPAVPDGSELLRPLLGIKEELLHLGQEGNLILLGQLAAGKELTGFLQDGGSLPLAAGTDVLSVALLSETYHSTELPVMESLRIADYPTHTLSGS